ncbi:MAG: OmpA family protein [Alphaproteobacteria bacterium]|nr:OmpA family protein [Alphaproteobacteria bacterium]
MAAQRRIATLVTAPARAEQPDGYVHPAAAFYVPQRDAFREKAERAALKRAEREARRKAAAAPAPEPAPAMPDMPALEPETPEPAPVAPPVREPLFGQERPTAAIIPWPVRQRVTATAETPVLEKPPSPAPSAPASPAADQFDSSAFWVEKKPGGGGSGEGPGGGSGGSNGGGGRGDVMRERGFSQDDIAGLVMVLLILLLLGWMLFNQFVKPGAGERAARPQVAATAPPPAPPPPKKDPFAGGPVDLKPKSPPPSSSPEDASGASPQALLDAPPESEPGSTASSAPAPAKAAPPVAPFSAVTAQAAPSPPTPTVAPAGATCAPGRMIHAYYCTARSELTAASRAALDKELADWRACVAGGEVVVQGYADTRGSSEFNAALGESRATQMAKILRAQGFNVSEIKGVGELQGLEDGQNCANQRRVDIGLKSEIDGATPSRACAPPKEAAPLQCAAASGGSAPSDRAR